MTNQRPVFFTSPCFSTNWNALMSLSVSSTLRPTGRSLMDICLTTPSGSIMNRPAQFVYIESLRFSASILILLSSQPTSEGDAGLLYEHPVVPGDVLVEV